MAKPINVVIDLSHHQETVDFEQIKSDGEFCRREFAGEFAKIQESVDRMQNIVENMARLEAARAEPVSTKMN